MEKISDTLSLKNIENHSWNLLCCSAYSGENLEKAFDWLVNDYEKKYYIL